MTEFTEFDPAEFLHTEEDMEEYLNIAMESGDSHTIALALGAVARAKGMTEVAEEAGLSREALCRALGPSGNPTLDTLMRVFGALGVRMGVRAVPQA